MWSLLQCLGRCLAKVAGCDFGSPPFQRSPFVAISASNSPARISARILISVARLRKQSWEKRSPKQGGTRRARTVEGRDALMREAHRLIEADKGNPPW
jgi:hypothetical protein